MLDIQGGAHKKRVRRSSLLNAKKLYEDAQMARKVKQYLSNLTVETDEEKHQIMSLQCEPTYSTCEKPYFSHVLFISVMFRMLRSYSPILYLMGQQIYLKEHCEHYYYYQTVPSCGLRHLLQKK